MSNREILILALVCLIAGFMVRGWYEGTSSYQKLSKDVTETIKKEDTSVPIVQDMLAEGRAEYLRDKENEKKIVKVLTRTVYSNVCLDADGVSIINGVEAKD